ncbi:MAG: DUF222 domain-containing protein [Dermatophilaceae bacterium]
MAVTQLREREIREFISELALLDGCGDGVDDAARVQLISVLESLKAAAAAAQARVSMAFDQSQREAQRGVGVAREKVGAGIAEQVALARRESPTLGSRHLGLARALVTEMPHTMAALTAGELSEWRATLIARATAVLSTEQRREVDVRLAGRLSGLSDKQVAAAAHSLAYELDPRTVVERHAYARGQRRVSVRQAPDTMAYLTALLPAPQAIAVYAALTRAASTARSEGDPRGADQIKADTLVERATGQARATQVPVEIGLVMSDTTLTDDDHAPAVLLGFGPIPGGLARELVRDTVRAHRTASETPTVGATRPHSHGPSEGRHHPTSDQTCLAEILESSPRAPSKRDIVDEWSGGDVPAAQVWVRRLYTDPRNRHHHRCRPDATTLPRASPPPDRGSRSVVPHPLLRSADQAHRPRRAIRKGRLHHSRQRPRAVRAVQPGQGNSGVGDRDPAAARRHRRRRDQDAAGPHLSLDRAALARRLTSAGPVRMVRRG